MSAILLADVADGLRRVGAFVGTRDVGDGVTVVVASGARDTVHVGPFRGGMLCPDADGYVGAVAVDEDGNEDADGTDPGWQWCTLTGVVHGVAGIVHGWTRD